MARIVSAAAFSGGLSAGIAVTRRLHEDPGALLGAVGWGFVDPLPPVSSEAGS